MTAATLAAGTRCRHAGTAIALGHAVIEFPLMLLIVTGAGQIFQFDAAKTAIGLVGGLFLIIMGVQLLLAAPAANDNPAAKNQRGPFVTGVLLTAANPYFLIWWATVGLALTTQAVELGVVAFALFAVVHWLCDLLWLEALSLASHKGTDLLGGRLQQIVLVVCGLMLLGFGSMFLYDAGSEQLLYRHGPAQVGSATVASICLPNRLFFRRRL